MTEPRTIDYVQALALHGRWLEREEEPDPGSFFHPLFVAEVDLVATEDGYAVGNWAAAESLWGRAESDAHEEHNELDDSCPLCRAWWEENK